jgi:cellulose synthase (UDP-forming)
VAVGILVAASIYGLARNLDAATINNVSFAAVHVSILMTGCWAALQKPRAPAPGPLAPVEAVA